MAETADYKILLNDENAEQIAKYLVDTFVTDGTNENIDHKFDLKKGSMTNKVTVNTWFKFDTKPDTLLNEIKKSLFPPEAELEEEAKMLESMNDDQKAEYDRRNKEMFDTVVAWLVKVKEIINTKYVDELRNKIRDTVVKAPPQVFPLARVEVLNIELTEIDPEGDYVIVVNKMSPKGAQGGVSADLMQEHISSKKELQTIIEEKKAAGDPLYKFVRDAYKKKYAFECELDLFVDYSLGPKFDRHRMN